ncbi:MAG: PqqD family protein [Velocimicrobium sp.]
MKNQPYRIRHVAGLYWMFKADQQGEEYVPPLVLNECGALLWNGLESGSEEIDLIELLQKSYGITKTKAEEDVKIFLEQLKNRGFLN